jgi:thiamine pyrophosphate-dependent acetolactate synthase large subunit-like protein
MKRPAKSTTPLDRRAVVARLLAARGDAVVITGLGSATYDVAAAGDHPRNFYLWGAMGGAAMVGLGLALAQPRVPVIVVTGDGEMLMAMGAFATIAQQRPGNLTLVVLDNALYGETGGQPSHVASGADLVAIAKGCGLADGATLGTMAEVGKLAARAHRIGRAPTLAVIKVAPGEADKVVPLRDGGHNRARLRLALGLSVD